MPSRFGSLTPLASIFGAMALAGLGVSGCTMERERNDREAGVTATGNTGRISGRVDSIAGLAAARSTTVALNVKVFLFQVRQGTQGDSLLDSVATYRGGTYFFDHLPDASFKLFAVCDADGWRSDTLRAEIRSGASVVLQVTVKRPDTTTVRKGMTWLKRKREDAFGVDFVHCKGSIAGAYSECDPYSGDQPCNALLHILCNKQEGLSRPPYAVDYPSVQNDPYYASWFEGRTALGPRVEGRSLRSKAVGDSVCSASLGAGWTMAGFHDGRYVSGMDSTSYYGASWESATKSSGAWGFYASTSNIPMDIRFWTSIDDQPANCWDP